MVGIHRLNTTKTPFEAAIIFLSGEFWCSGHPELNIDPCEFVCEEAKKYGITLLSGKDNNFLNRYFKK